MASLIHRSRDENLRITEEDATWASPMCIFFVYGGPEDRDLSKLDDGDLEGIYEGSYAPDMGQNRFIHGFEYGDDEIIHARALELDDEAFTEISRIFGEGFREATDREMTREEAEAFLDSSEVSTFLEKGGNTRIEEMVENGGWHIQTIRAETAARMGYVGVEDRDENGKVVIVSFRGRDELNDRFFLISEDPRFLAERNPDYAEMDSWGEVMLADIEARRKASEKVAAPEQRPVSLPESGADFAKRMREQLNLTNEKTDRQMTI